LINFRGSKLALFLLMLLQATYVLSAFGQTTIDVKYPGLFNGPLKYAITDSLPSGELLVAGEVKITQSQLDAEVKKVSANLQSQIKDNIFFLLENIAVDRLINAEVQAWAKSKKINLKSMKEEDVIKKFVEELTANVTVSQQEVKEYYESNKDAFKGAKFADVEPFIKPQLINEKKQEFLNKYVNDIGKRIVIKINDDWAKLQYPKAINNPVDKLRRSGKPSLVDFGTSGCVPCDMMAPMLKELKKEYSGIVNVEFIDVRENQILSARYSVSSIPVQIFFDKNGKEFYRHVGFFPKEQIIAKLKEMGVSK